MGTMKVMHPAKGHATLTWDPADTMSTAEAEAAFNELISHGMAGIVTTAEPGVGEYVTREFVPEAHGITVIAPLQGG